MKALSALFSLFFIGFSLAQPNPGLLSARRDLEAAASGATHLVWSSPVGLLESGATRATFTVLSVADLVRQGRQLRGIRVDLALPDWNGTLYFEAAALADLKKCADWLAKMAKAYPDVTDTFSVGGGPSEDPPRPFRLSYCRDGGEPALYLAYLGGSTVRSLKFTGVPPSNLAVILARAVRVLGR